MEDRSLQSHMSSILQRCIGLFSEILFSEIEHWTKGCILPFPKKGDITVLDNYRGITLTCIMAKIYNTLLREIIQPTIDMILRPNQNGFRNNRSTVGHIITVRMYNVFGFCIYNYQYTSF